MSREILPITNESEWLGWRQADVTSTDTAALCGVSQWKSPYQLWHEKRGHVATEPFEENEAMALGKHMEGPIAAFLAKKHGFEVEPFKNYIRIPELRLASSFDFIARDRSFLLEVKLVGPMQFARGWKQSDFGFDMPAEIEAQVQTEMICAEVPLCFIGVLCGTETHLIRRDLDSVVAERIQRSADEFWRMPEPKPDFNVDAEFISRLFSQSVQGKTIAADTRLAELLVEYNGVGKEIREFEKHREAVRAEIFTLAPDAERIEFDGGYALAKTQPETVVESFTRRASRPLRIYERKS